MTMNPKPILKAYKMYSVCLLIGAFVSLSLDLFTTIPHGFDGSVSFNALGEGWIEVGLAITLIPYVAWFLWTQGVKALFE